MQGCAPAVKNIGSRGTNIICFGDSITYGQGAEKGKDYPAYLGKYLKRKVINAGSPGDTTEDGLRRLEKDVLEKDPYLVIVEFGANDYLRGMPKEQAIRNLEEIIDKIHEKGAIVALCDVSGGSAFGVHDIYHDDLKRLALKTGSIFIPYLMKGIIQNPSLKTDNFHPNSKGYEIIAEKVYNSVKSYQ